MALNKEDKSDVKNAMGKALANKVSKVTKDGKRTNENHRMGKLLMDSGFSAKMYKDKKGDSFKGWSKK